jgi:hypothetical protein
MNTDFTILSVDEKEGTMVVDWGHIVLNHDIPLEILENPNITQDEVLQAVSYMRPPEPDPITVPDALKSLAQNVTSGNEVLL